MREDVRTLALTALVATFSLAFAPTAAKQTSAGKEVLHAVAGTITKVDDAAKTVAIKTARGTVETLKFTADTTVAGGEAVARGAKAAGGATLSATKEGVDVIAHYTRRGGDKVALAIQEMGKGTLKASRGVVAGVDKTARTVTLKGKDGSEEVYHYAETGAVDTERGLVKTAEATDSGLKVGEDVTVHFTESTGKRMAHLFSHSATVKE